MNYLAIDTEYSSFFSSEKHKSGDLLQLSIIPVIDNIPQEPFNEYIRPIGSVWNAHAEKVHGITRKRAKTFQTPAEAAVKLKAFIEQFDTVFTSIGHNPRGDKSYVDRFVSENRMSNEWHRRVKTEWRCTKDMASKKKSLIPVKNLQLETLCTFFRIPIKAHDALSDANATWLLFEAMSGMIAASKSKKSILDGSSEIDKIKKYNDIKYVQYNGNGTIFITEFATADREALRLILESIWNTYGEA